MRAFKFTAMNGVGMFTGFPWPLPAGGNPGAWAHSSGPASVCQTGVHACRVDQLPHWLGAELWEVELAGEIVESPHKVVAARGRLLARVPGWPHAARAFAEDCAERARQLASRELRAAGLGDLADAVRAAASTAELAPAVTAAREEATPLVAALTGYVFDCLLDVDNGDFAMCAYVAATAFANRSTGDVVQDMGSAGWAEERGRQAAWLATRLGLD